MTRGSSEDRNASQASFSVIGCLPQGLPPPAYALDIFILTDAGLLFQDGIWAFEYTLYGCRVICFDRDERMPCQFHRCCWRAGKDTVNRLRGCLTTASAVELPDIFLLTERVLKPGGILYVSFKYRKFEGTRRGCFLPIWMKGG